MLLSLGHTVLLHGRNRSKLASVENEITDLAASGRCESYVVDLSRLADVDKFGRAVAERHRKLDVLINNAGVFVTPEIITADGLDVRFAVNTIAPYLITKRLLPIMNATGRACGPK